MTNNRNSLQTALAIELAKAGLTQTDLALKAAWRPSTMNGWLRGIGRPPPDFIETIEKTLQIPRGSLSRIQTNSR